MHLTPRSCTPKAARHAFSLVELSVVLLIISVVFTLGLELSANFVTRSANDLTRNRLIELDNAIAAFYRINGRLPCPAVSATAPTTNTYGNEDCTIAVLTSTTIGGGVQLGAVPFRTLNLPMSSSIDGFYSKINYAVTRNLTAAGTSSSQFAYTTSLPYTACAVAAGTGTLTMASTAGLAANNVVYVSGNSAAYRVASVTANTNITVSNFAACTTAVGNVVALQPGGIEVRTGILEQPCNTSRCSVLANPASYSGAAYLLFSNGYDKRGARNMRGNASACIPTADTATYDGMPDTQNCISYDGTLEVASIPLNVFYDNRLNPRSFLANFTLSSAFDDLVIWRGKDKL